MTIFKSYKRSKLVAILFSHGYILTEGGNHSKFYCEKHEVTIVIPRHTIISAGIIKQSTKKLVRYCGFDEEYLLRVLR